MWTQALALCALLLLLLSWVAVQRAWQRVFPEASDDPDALAGRTSCHGAPCHPDCAGGRACRFRSREEEKP